MGSFEDQHTKQYYSVLGLGNDASASAIRVAYKQLAMKWHPDKCSGQSRAEAKVKFQEVQEAYAVLSDVRKKMLYDYGIYDPEDDGEDVEGLSSFINEMSDMMIEVQASEESSGRGSSLEELQQLFENLFSADGATFNNNTKPPSATSINLNVNMNKGWGGG